MENSAQQAGGQPRHFFSVTSVTPLRPLCWRLVLAPAIGLRCFSALKTFSQLLHAFTVRSDHGQRTTDTIRLLHEDT